MKLISNIKARVFRFWWKIAKNFSLHSLAECKYNDLIDAYINVHSVYVNFLNIYKISYMNKYTYISINKCIHEYKHPYAYKYIHIYKNVLTASNGNCFCYKINFCKISCMCIYGHICIYAICLILDISMHARYFAQIHFPTKLISIRRN